jgi:CubicO group peptidase (beta-lactamase class C family)
MRNHTTQLDALMDCYTWFNGNVMVAKDHKIIYERVQGYANFLTREPLNNETVFELASVSKQFTAIAILILCERNTIDLDDPVHLFVPELPYPDITIRQLLNHTSGLPNYMWVLENKWTQAHFPSNEELIAELVRHKPHSFFRAGRRYSYSNTGYALLASVVERATGKSYSQFLRENIFEPLEMRNTYTSAEILDSIYTVQKLAQGHHSSGRRHIINAPVIHDKVLGDKGIHSNMADLFKWDQALYTEKLISHELLEQAYEPLVFSNRRSLPYGFGFRIGNCDDEKYVYHHGLWEGFRTSLIRHIEHGNTIIILNNTNQRVNTQIIRQIQEILDEPLDLSPTQLIALAIVEDGLESAFQLFEEMKADGLIDYPDANELLELTGALLQMHKPVLSSMVYKFYETTCLCKEELQPLAKK